MNQDTEVDKLLVRNVDSTEEDMPARHSARAQGDRISDERLRELAEEMAAHIGVQPRPVVTAVVKARAGAVILSFPKARVVRNKSQQREATAVFQQMRQLCPEISDTWELVRVAERVSAAIAKSRRAP